MPDVSNVGGHALVFPAGAAQDERLGGMSGGRTEEELLDARLAVGQAVAEKAEAASEAWIGRFGEVRRRVESIVDRHARARAQTQIRIHERRAPAVGGDR